MDNNSEEKKEHIKSIEKAKKATYFVAMFCLGMILGGAISQITSLWVIGLVLLVLDVIIGIILQKKIDDNSSSQSYYSNKDELYGEMQDAFKKALKESLDYEHRVSIIVQDENKKEYFTRKEIMYAVVNLVDARNKLPKRDSIYVERAFQKLDDIFSRNEEKILMDKNCYLREAYNLISHFDLIAPYYMFCGNSENMLFHEVFDDLKNDYRIRARKILEAGRFLTDEWNKLQKEFATKFYDL